MNFSLVVGQLFSLLPVSHWPMFHDCIGGIGGLGYHVGIGNGAEVTGQSKTQDSGKSPSPGQGGDIKRKTSSPISYCILIQFTRQGLSNATCFWGRC